MIRQKLKLIEDSDCVKSIYRCGNGWVIDATRPGGNICFTGQTIVGAIDKFLSDYKKLYGGEN